MYISVTPIANNFGRRLNANLTTVSTVNFVRTDVYVSTNACLVGCIDENMAAVYVCSSEIQRTPKRLVWCKIAHKLQSWDFFLQILNKKIVVQYYSSWFICCLRYCWSFHPSSSSSTLVWSSWYFSWLVFILSYLTFSGSLHPKFHFIFLKSFLWCTSRFGPWPTSFHSLYNSSWLCHLQELNQIPPLCWWHPAVHFFHSFKFNFFAWKTL